jgi:hypothetical protein
MLHKAEIITNSIKDKLYYDKKLMITINISYPQIKGLEKKFVQMKINKQFETAAQKINKRARTVLYQEAIKQYKYAVSQGFPFNAYEVMSVFETTYNRSPLISIYSDVYEYTGGAHGNTVRYADTFDTNDGKRLKLADLFKKGYEYKPVILKEIERQADLMYKNGFQFFEDYKKGIITYFNEDNYYLFPNGLAIYYPLYTIAPYVSGIIVFTIPYYLFGNNLKYGL